MNKLNATIIFRFIYKKRFIHYEILTFSFLFTLNLSLGIEPRLPSEIHTFSLAFILLSIKPIEHFR